MYKRQTGTSPDDCPSAPVYLQMTAPTLFSTLLRLKVTRVRGVWRTTVDENIMDIWYSYLYGNCSFVFVQRGSSLDRWHCCPNGLITNGCFAKIFFVPATRISFLSKSCPCRSRFLRQIVAFLLRPADLSIASPKKKQFFTPPIHNICLLYTSPSPRD